MLDEVPLEEVHPPVKKVDCNDESTEIQNRIVAPGMAFTVSDTQLIFEDFSHSGPLKGVLAVLIALVVCGIFFTVFFKSIGLLISSFLVSLLIPMVILLMASRKVTIDKTKGKIRQVTQKYFFVSNVEIVPIKAITKAELRTKASFSGQLRSKVVLEIEKDDFGIDDDDDDDDIDVTLFYETPNMHFKQTLVNRINQFLHDNGLSDNDLNM